MTNGCNNWRGHRWGRWGEPVQVDALPPHPPGTAHLVQERSCERCGMVQKYTVSRLSAAEPGA